MMHLTLSPARGRHRIRGKLMHDQAVPFRHRRHERSAAVRKDDPPGVGGLPAAPGIENRLVQFDFVPAGRNDHRVAFPEIAVLEA